VNKTAAAAQLANYSLLHAYSRTTAMQLPATRIQTKTSLSILNELA